MPGAGAASACLGHGRPRPPFRLAPAARPRPPPPRPATMKFAALLRAAAAEMPEVQDLFACYKTLKKRLKQLPQQGLTRPEPHDGPGPEPEPRRELNPDQERWFVEQVDREVVALNESFIEKEEDNVIRMRSLEDAARAADTSAKLAAIYKVLRWRVAGRLASIRAHHQLFSPRRLIQTCNSPSGCTQEHCAYVSCPGPDKDITLVRSLLTSTARFCCWCTGPSSLTQASSRS